MLISKLMMHFQVAVPHWLKSYNWVSVHKGYRNSILRARAFHTLVNTEAYIRSCVRVVLHKHALIAQRVERFALWASKWNGIAPLTLVIVNLTRKSVKLENISFVFIETKYNDNHP